ncbi:MAG: hypothetical protein GXY86_15890 [Firmicutes bacterium]|nr:hypothetical protein [Bacillota bacterium]
MNNQKPQVKAFIEEIIEVCKKYGFSIGHEDTQGAFKIKEYNTDDIEWFGSAIDYTKK